ncbi:MAG: hypothetical protein LBQ93_07160 [Treponema sp.]|jgi:hypothetical protein|nr:hypothetical protein [Treponema sp.]
MAKEIAHYEVTNSYGDIKKGFRFDVEYDHTGHIDGFIKKALEKATGVEARLINLSMLKCKKI